MSINVILLILVSVSMSAVAQLMLKIGMSGSGVQAALARGASLDTALVVGTNYRVLLGLGLYGLGAVLWLLVLSKTDLSIAYPFVGLGFILTMLFALWFLNEPVGPARMIGTLLIVVGVVLVSRS